MKSYDVTIQMKVLCLYLHMLLFVFQNFTNGEIWKFGRDFLLVKFGSKRVKFDELLILCFIFSLSQE